METSKTKHNYEKKQKRGEGNKKKRKKKEILKRNKLFNNKREGKLTYKDTHTHPQKGI